MENRESKLSKCKLAGWKWFWPPVVVNGFYHIVLQTFDYNYTANIARYFSIPYFVLAAVIGVRRGSGITIPDFVFLVFGDFIIVGLLWLLKSPHNP